MVSQPILDRVPLLEMHWLFVCVYNSYIYYVPSFQQHLIIYAYQLTIADL